MRKILDVAIREYNAAVRTKAFIISVVLMPIMMGGGIVMHRLLKDQVDLTPKRIAVIDHSAAIGPFLVNAAKVYNETAIFDKESKAQNKPRIEIELVAPQMDEGEKPYAVALSDRVREKELSAWVEIGARVVDPAAEGPAGSVAYHSKGSLMDSQLRWLGMEINNQTRSLRMADAEVDEATIQGLIAPVRIENLGLVSVDEATGEVASARRTNEIATLVVPMVMMMLMFMMVTMGATPLVNSVLEEKMQRIAEVLLGSVTPFQLMMGKLLGTVGVSFTVGVIYFVGGALTVSRVGASEYIPYHILPWFFAYQTAAVLMFGAMFVALGSACNDLKEAQSLMMPIWLVVCAPLFVWFQVVRQPLSNFSTGLSLFPPCTPMLMLLRQTTPEGVPAWQPWAGLAGVVLCTLLCVWIAGRIFRVGLLLQGQPPKVSEIFRWAVKG
jgi:ABC-2 type transport system permease protein